MSNASQQNDSRIKVIIADDHQIVRVGLRTMLEKNDEFVVVAEAETGKKAVELVDQYIPHLVLMDILMPEWNGIEATKEIRAKHPEIRVVMLTSLEDRYHIRQALKVGAMGYISKNVEPDELFQLLYRVLNGYKIYSHSVLKMLENAELPWLSEAAQIGTVELTPREQEILELIAHGLSSKEIAQRLSISRRTVETHRARLMKKLHARNTAELVRFALLHL